MIFPSFFFEQITWELRYTMCVKIDHLASGSLICWMFIQHHYMCPCVACTGVCLRIYRENEREKRKTITQGTRPIRLMTPNSHRYYRIECPSAFFVVISLEFYCSSNSDLFALKESGVKHQHKNLLPSFLVTS